jgi:hypothetical protein
MVEIKSAAYLPFRLPADYDLKVEKPQVCDDNKPPLAGSDIAPLELYYMALGLDIYADKSVDVAYQRGAKSVGNADVTKAPIGSFYQEYKYADLYTSLTASLSPEFQPVFAGKLGTYEAASTPSKIAQLKAIKEMLKNPPTEMKAADKDVLELYFMALGLDLQADGSVEVSYLRGDESLGKKGSLEASIADFFKEYKYEKFYTSIKSVFSPRFLTYFETKVGPHEAANTQRKTEQIKLIQAMMMSAADEAFCAKPKPEVAVTAPAPPAPAAPIVAPKPGNIFEFAARLRTTTGDTSTPYELRALSSRPNLEVQRLRLGKEFANGAHPMAASQKTLYDDQQLAGTGVMPVSVPTEHSYSIYGAGSLALWENGSPKPAKYSLGATKSWNYKNIWFPYAGAEIDGQWFNSPTRYSFQNPLFLKLNASPAQVGYVKDLGNGRSLGAALRPMTADFTAFWPGSTQTYPQLKIDSRLEYLFSSGLDIAANLSRVNVNFGANVIWPWFSQRRESGTLDTSAAGQASDGSSNSNQPTLCMTGEDFSACPASPKQPASTTGSQAASGSADTIKYNPVRNIFGLDLRFNARFTVLADGKLTLTPLAGYSTFKIGRDSDSYSSYSGYGGAKVASTLGTARLLGSVTALGGKQKVDPYLPYEGGFAKMIVDVALGRQRKHAVSLFADYNGYHSQAAGNAAVWTFGLGYRYLGVAREEKKISGAHAFDSPEASPTPAPLKAKPAPEPAADKPVDLESFPQFKATKRMSPPAEPAVPAKPIAPDKPNNSDTVEEVLGGLDTK